jgi:integrase
MQKVATGLYIRVQRLLGHADLQMATRYVQDVSAQTDRVIENSRIYVCQISK